MTEIEGIEVYQLNTKRQAPSNEHKTRVRKEHGSTYILIPSELARRLKLALNSELVLEVSTLPFYQWELKIRVPRERTQKEKEDDELLEKLIEDIERIKKEKGDKDGWVHVETTPRRKAGSH